MPYFHNDIEIHLEVYITRVGREQMHTHQDNPSLCTQCSWTIPFPILPDTHTTAPVNNPISILVITTLAQGAVMDMAQWRLRST